MAVRPVLHYAETYPSIEDDGLLARIQLQLPHNQSTRVQIRQVLLSREDLAPRQLVEEVRLLFPIVNRHFWITESKRVEKALGGDLGKEATRDELREEA